MPMTEYEKFKSLTAILVAISGKDTQKINQLRGKTLDKLDQLVENMEVKEK